MAKITATNVATVVSEGHSWIGDTWTSLRDAATGTSIDTSSDGTDLGVNQYSVRGATFIQIYRVFFELDTSGISIAPSAATLQIYGRTNDDADFYVVRATHSGAPATADFDAIHGWDTTNAADGAGNGDQIGNVTLYSSQIASWSTSGYNNITLNATALSQMASDSTFAVCLIESVHDLLDVSETTSSKTGMYFDDDAGKEIKIDYTAGVAAVATNSIFFGANF